MAACCCSEKSSLSSSQLLCGARVFALAVLDVDPQLRNFQLQIPAWCLWYVSAPSTMLMLGKGHGHATLSEDGNVAREFGGVIFENGRSVAIDMQSSGEIFDHAGSLGYALVPLEASFRPFEEAAMAGGTMTRHMPENIYSAGVLSWLASPGGWQSAALVTLAVLALTATYVVQFTFAYHLLGAVGKEPLASTCTGTSSLLRHVAVLTFCSLICFDLLETYDMHLWISMFPSARSHEKLAFVKSQDLSASHHPAIGRTTSGIIWVFRPASGITRRVRVLFYVCVISGKLLVALSVLAGGAGAILRSADNFDCVLNSVAAAFIIEIARSVYGLYVPRYVRKLFTSLPALGLTEAERAKRPLRFHTAQKLHFYLVAALVFLLNGSVMHAWC